MAVKQEIIDELLKDYKNPEDLPGEDELTHPIFLSQASEGATGNACFSGLIFGNGGGS